MQKVDMECSRDLSFSCALPRKSYRRRWSNFTKAWSWCKALLVITNLFILLLSKTYSAEAYEDWTNLCSSKCKCTWVGGMKTADCQGAGFNTIPAGLSPELQVLDLSFNFISQLNKNAFEEVGLVNLWKMLLRSCQIEKIDRNAFHNLKIMIELDLTGNKLESLDMEAFESNEQLRELRLGENPLTKLHGVQFPPLLDLQLLDLRNCQLSQLSKNTFDKLFNLEQLYLMGNKFQYISEQVFKPLAKLKSLSLHNNPWKCDCRLRSFRDWVIAHKLLLSVTCAEPSHLKSFKWSILQSTDFACKPEILAQQINGEATKTFTVDADIGGNITLECLVRADPAPEVNWVRHGQDLVNSSRNDGNIRLLQSSSGECERWVNLTFLKSNVDDAGEYTCVGKNIGGVAVNYLTLKQPGLDIDGKLDPCHEHFLSWIFFVVISSTVIITVVILTLSFAIVNDE